MRKMTSRALNLTEEKEIELEAQEREERETRVKKRQQQKQHKTRKLWRHKCQEQRRTSQPLQ